jgi:hypothetical protein
MAILEEVRAAFGRHSHGEESPFAAVWVGIGKSWFNVLHQGRDELLRRQVQ